MHTHTFVLVYIPSLHAFPLVGLPSVASEAWSSAVSARCIPHLPLLLLLFFPFFFSSISTSLSPHSFVVPHLSPHRLALPWQPPSSTPLVAVETEAAQDAGQLGVARCVCVSALVSGEALGSESDGAEQAPEGAHLPPHPLPPPLLRGCPPNVLVGAGARTALHS